ncbi:MAG TPA: serine/threonine-protein kinase [Polyangiaceae bacterium]
MLNPGDIIDGKYRIVRLMGEGGMGAVYEGENTRIHRRVAIKVLHASVAEQGEAVARFEREAQAAGRIGSEHIVEVLDLGTLPSGDRYLVMEFLDGEGLGNRIKARGRLTAQELSPIAFQLMEGLAAAHGAGIIHRDLKPDNVFLLRTRGGKADFVKLLDFGISKFSALSGDSGFSMTRTGAVMGTPYDMAPEQAKGSRELDHRVDIYATGVILYEALTGQVPFNADTFNELLFKIVLEEPKPLEQVDPSIDRGFAAIVSKAMARDPAHRFQNATDMQNAVSMWANGNGAELASALNQGRPTATNVAVATRPGGQPTLGTGTPGTWAQSGTNLDATNVVPTKSNLGLVAALALGGLVVVGGGGFVAMKAFSGGDTEAAKAADEQAKRAAAATEAERAQLETERKAAEQASKEAGLARAEAEKVMADATKAKDEAAKAAASAQAAAKAAPTVAPVPAPRPAARPATAKTAAPKAPSKEATKPAPTGTSTGRKIRTSL